MVRIWKVAMAALLACLALSQARAQVFEISGGNSSLYEAGGGSISMHAPGYDATIGAGMIGGHFSYGAKMEKAIGPDVYSAGDEQIDFLLPTDVFDPSHYMFGRGLGYKANRQSLNVFAFGGTSSTLYETPIFEGAGFGTGMGFLSIRKTVSPAWKFWSDTVFSGKMSQIAAAQWQPARKFQLAASGGIGANQPYGAASINLSRRYLDVLGSYVSAGSNFRRVVVSSPIQAEPDKGNLLLTLKPTSFLTISGGTQNFLVPTLTSSQTVGPNIGSSVRNAAVNLQVAKASLSGNIYSSSALGESDNAAAFSASRDVTHWVRLMSSYMVSKPKGSAGANSFFSTITENLNQHISVNQSINNSNGQTSFLYGGSLLTNFVTFSANYETFYVPVRTANPFQQSLMLDVSLHLFGRASLHASNFVGPTGAMMYTATADAIAIHGQDNEEPAANQFASIGDSVLRVQVVDAQNRPVEGAALVVDAKPVFTDQDGTFSLRERKPRQHTLHVLTDQFLDGGKWQVESMPQTVRSSIGESDAPAVVVVRRIPAQVVATQTAAVDPEPPPAQK